MMMTMDLSAAFSGKLPTDRRPRMCRWIPIRGETWPVGMVRQHLILFHPSKGDNHPINHSIVVLKSKLTCWAFGLETCDSPT